MRKNAVLVNAARGGVVDESALAEALRNGTIRGAALDVFETEPLTAEAGRKFAGLDNLVLTPHIAGVTEESNVRVSNLVADLVAAHLGKSS
jgi:(S)-sulfolactate dehydrogenase